ncbi:MAG: methyltransferase domain-containing protein [Anaerolineae bacterium]|nr:methyltransferase domain-containing protein [Anaerolineae bacterium]
MSETPIQATLRQVYVHWPAYLVGYGGGALLALVVVFISMQRQWWGFIPLMLAFLLLLAYFFAASLWVAYQKNETAATLILLTWAQLQPTDSFAHIDLGRRSVGERLARYLTTGKLTVIDVYNPQLTPGAALARARSIAGPMLLSDPRLTCLEGSIDLLPLPDKSMLVVTMIYTLPEFWQQGDQEQLLQEIYRILKPGGRLILLEQARQPANIMMLGPLVWHWPAAAHWQHLLQKTGFTIRKQEMIQAGLTVAFRADKPVQFQNRQLDLRF